MAEENIFPKLIKDIRKRLGLTQAEFGQMFEPTVSQQSVGQWERGENDPTKKYWLRIAELAEMEFSTLIALARGGVSSTSSYLDEIIFAIKDLPLEALEVITEVTARKWQELGQPKTIANKQHLVFLKKGRTEWNKWRKNNPDIRPELGGADLSGINLSPPKGEIGINLRYADLRGAQLNSSNLNKADLSSADLSGAELTKVSLKKADLSYANLSGSNLSGSWLSEANLRSCNLSQANLRASNFNEANLRGSNLEGADLTLADLRWAILVETNLEKAILNSISIYGASIWEVKLDETKLSIYTSTFGDTTSSRTTHITNLNLAQTIYTLNNDSELHQMLKKRFEDEAAVEKYARQLLFEYGRGGSDDSYLPSTHPGRDYRIISCDNTFQVIVIQRKEPVILEVVNDQVYSNILPGDVETLKEMVEFEEAQKAKSQEASIKGSSTPQRQD